MTGSVIGVLILGVMTYPAKIKRGRVLVQLD